jgi:ParB family transcriptional regulator, chromosome partitioning protein
MDAAEATTAEQPESRTEPAPEYVHVSIAELERTDAKNIREIDASTLDELAVSIKEHGILEPVLVTRGPKGFRLVAGFRRVAAAKAAGLKSVPARVVELTEVEVLESQLVENLQREDLGPIDEARALQQLMEAGSLTQAQAGKKIGRSQAYVANRIRLLGLPAPVQQLVGSGELSSSHAEVLLRIPKEAEPIIVQAAKEAAKRSTSVNELNRDVSWKAKRHLEALAFKKAVDESKFPKCPTCGKRATERNYDGSAGHGNYEDRHQWSLATGKTQADRLEAERSKLRKSAAARGAETRSKLPEVDRSQPNVIHAGPDPLTIAKAVLEQLPPDSVLLVDLETQWDGQERLIVSFPGKSAAKLAPLGKHVRFLPAAYSTGERTAVLVESCLLADARKKALQAIAKWQASSLTSPKLKEAKPPAVDEKLLKGSVDEVLPRIAKLRKDVETLEAVRVAEAVGKARGGVLDWIDATLWNSHAG